MRGQAGSRKRITFNYPQEIIRIVLMLCLLGSVAGFAASHEQPAWKNSSPAVRAIQPSDLSPARQGRVSTPAPAQPVRSVAKPPADLPQTEPHSLANLQPLPENVSFRPLWIAAGIGLIFALRRQRRRV